MAYDARKKEVMDLYEDTEWGEVETRHVELLGRILDTYFNRRAHHLGQILDVLQPGRTTPSMPVWLDRAMAGVRMVHDTFEDVPEPLQEWSAGIASHEHGFFFAIYRCPVAKWRDTMVGQQEALEKAKEEFEDKWKDMLDRDDDLEDKMKKAAGRFEEVLMKAAKAAAEAEKTTKEKTAKAVAAGLGGALKVVDLGVAEQALEVAMKAIERAVSEVNDRKLEVLALLSLENQIFATFGDAREAVEEFLETNGYPQIKDAWDEGEDAIEEIVGKMSTSGQKTDAAEYVKAVKGHLEKVFKVAESEYKEFAKKHEHLFFGPLGSSWHRQLGESDLWKDFSDDWKDEREDFDDLLRDRWLSVRRDEAFGVDLDDLTDEQYEEFERVMRSRAQELLRAWNLLKQTAGKAAVEMLQGHEQTRRSLDAMT